MGSRSGRRKEGVAYFSSLKTHRAKIRVRESIEGALWGSHNGRVVGSGTSLCDDGTFSVELKVFDLKRAESTLLRALQKIKVEDYELVWE
jgi:hypothetical protein